MIFRSLDQNSDWSFGKGVNDFTSGVDAIKLNIKTRLMSWVGDCFFDMTAGIDWLNRLGSLNQRSLLEADLRRIILQSEGVTGITSFQTSVVNRTFSASYSVNTIYSTEFTDLLTLEVG